ncbi:MAG: 2-C-methyl-D-erythritol 2,4-cyclodiphosphate synthase [Defluviitaleaceae bacterium]|nr:2-C-methyl-D-erythritol 2,4-cyclodiphosphate synthase [Defluviitaleaceae bacterium]
MRIGIGYDVHALAAGRRLVLGGVEIPHHLGLDGHSDADVLAHAIMDALLGAAGLGDIGRHFPDNDPAWKDADSIKMLEKVGWMVFEEGYKIGNIDATIIAQKPKLAGFMPEMEQNIATALRLYLDEINIKATTEEGLGFTGSEQGISAQAVALIVKK